jgi:hypothetical protein
VEDILKKQKEICGRRYGSPQFGDTVFPGETVTREVAAYFPEEWKTAVH